MVSGLVRGGVSASIFFIAMTAWAANTTSSFDAVSTNVASSPGTAAAQDYEQYGSEAGVCNSGDMTYCSDRRWTVTADALLLQRSSPRGPQLLSDPSSSDSLFDSSGLGFSHAAGPRLSFIRHGDVCDLEVNYFGIDGWKADADFPNASFPSGVGILALDNSMRFPVSDVAFQNTTRLYNAEFNVRRSFNDWLTGLAGFRWMELEDCYVAQGTGAILSSPFSESVRAHNHLFGFQLGTEAVLFGRQERFQIRGLGKAGIFGNAAAQNTDFSDPAGLGTLSTDASSSHASFVGEVGLAASYQLTKHMMIRGGYQVMWVEGVALAPRQIPNADLAGGATTLEDTGGLFFHGANAGIEITW